MAASSGGTARAGDQQVVVAQVPIKQRTTITADMLEVKSVPLNAVIGRRVHDASTTPSARSRSSRSR